MVARRETVSSAAKLAIRTDRGEILANGEDLAFCTVEVHDAQGRVLPITDQEVTFTVTGPGRLIGVGNGDPTSHESDLGPSRQAFSGLCMGIVQAGKSAGDIRIEVTSPGLAAASIALAAKAVALRPQVAEWEREVPKGSGVTGLWRPTSATGSSGPDPLQLAVAGDTLYTLVQTGAKLTGMLEAPGSGFGPGGGAVGGPIEGEVDRNTISFHVGTTTYTGTVNGEQIELQRKASWNPTAESPQKDTGPRSAIGPPPDGTDPSLAGFRMRGTPPPIILRRASR
jgi:beta-galactosidase